MLGGTAVTDAVREVIASNRAVAAVVIGIMLFDRVDHRPADLHGFIEGLRFYAVGAVMAGTAFDHRDFCIRNQLQEVARFWAEILYALMA